MSSERKGWSGPLDAVVMAGDRNGYRAVCGENKALLEIEGKPVIAHVVEALRRCRYVARIFIVGPRERIAEALGEDRRGEGPEVVLVEQRGSVLENAWKAFLATLPGVAPEEGAVSEESLRARYGDKVVLFLGADLPLLTPYELEEFIEGCDMDRYDYVLGLTAEESLRPYYPGEGKPGIKLAYFHFRDSLERQNNLHMARVFRVVNRDYAQLMYRFRYQRKWWNVFSLLWVLLRMPELRAGMVARFCLLHLSRVLGGIPWIPLQLIPRRFLRKERLERDVGLLLRTRFGSRTTTYGGAALDVDDVEHLEVIRLRFQEWRAYQEELHRKRQAAAAPPAAAQRLEAG